MRQSQSTKITSSCEKILSIDPEKKTFLRDSLIFIDFSFLLELSVVNDAQENASCSLVRRKLLQKSMVTTCHQGYQKEINQIAGLLETDKLEEEWPVLQRMLSWFSQKMHLSTVCKRIIRADDMFPRFSKLCTCTTAICISVTSVECERRLSTQNRIKSKYRSSIMTENLNNLITFVLNENSLTIQGIQQHCGMPQKGDEDTTFQSKDHQTN